MNGTYKNLKNNHILRAEFVSLDRHFSLDSSSVFCYNI